MVEVTIIPVHTCPIRSNSFLVASCLLHKVGASCMCGDVFLLVSVGGHKGLCSKSTMLPEWLFFRRELRSPSDLRANNAVYHGEQQKEYAN